MKMKGEQGEMILIDRISTIGSNQCAPTIGSNLRTHRTLGRSSHLNPQS